ncbi:carboxymuconolactone decarboxylase family protein [Nocardia cyriacigeorgica]|nr:carboxymuconolactone decarboxylase family protein [Nocardia cyriacigeorgica]MBF6101744.1 carboxymuconolactone decarboxylase family protein [Nocardia cyriacigeorgica]MBF6322322.1 carboxymuconolactone decarboxylase family protein [Nocardia cyriacigeorgica]MBF6498870.1 carboxymuconolactone decarboxylase family protein [Nocardia cyriacigeorgica]MBF6513594.1 carboxymuconolactone decarboxylase family protein [Nocardia cyriacigeorgica]
MSMTTAEQTRVSRMPNPVQLVPEMGQIAAALRGVTGTGTIDPATIGLVQLRAGQIVGSTYLAVLHTSALRNNGESEERIAAVATWPTSPYFSDAERAALALVEAVLQPSASAERVSDALYEQVSSHYSDREIATLAMVIGEVNFYIPLAVIGKPLPGVTPSRQWTPVPTP